MNEAASLTQPYTAQPATEIEKAEKAKKKKDKLRSAWIAFVGRILAQVIGATAAIVLGLMFLQHRSGGAAEAGSGPAVVSAATLARVPPDARSVAVLPLQNFSGDAAADYFGDGLTEAIITSLSQIPSLRVVSRTSSMPYKQAGKPLREIAGELGVRWIVEGSYIRRGGRTRVTVQLIDARTDQHRWARSYDRTQHDMLAVQTDFATAIARDLGGAFAPEDEQ